MIIIMLMVTRKYHFEENNVTTVNNVWTRQYYIKK